MSKDSDHCEACGAPDDGTQTYCERCGEPLVDPKYIRPDIAEDAEGIDPDERSQWAHRLP